MKDNKKIIISSILGVIALCIITLSLTYAYWQINKNQTGENVVNTDCFDIEFVGENDINLPKAYPFNDEELEEFIGSATPYTFTITNKCSSLASAAINMETVPIEGKKLSDEWIDILLYDAVKNNPNSYLNKSKKLTGNDDNTENKVIETSEKAYALYNFTLKANEEKKFNLLIYMNQDTPAKEENMNATWKGKITLSTSYKVDQYANAGTLRQIASSDTQGMWGYKDKIIKLVIQNKLQDIPDKTYGPFDESSDSSNSIQSYVVCEEGDINCIGYLQGNEKIILNENSSNLFYKFSKVTTIEGMDNLDTSSVTSMSWMFSWMSALQSLDLGSNFDTSSATDMSYMFYNSSALKSLDLSKYNFDTSSVTDMHDMFGHMSRLQELNLGNQFDTSNVGYMSEMFYNLSALKSLDLSKYNFNTSNVKSMGSMFKGMSALQELNLGSKFDTSSVTNMSSMFTNMSALQNLDLSKYNFNTSNVTDMSFMFYGMNKLQILDLGANFNTSNVGDMDCMFYGMSSLERLDLSTLNFDTSRVTDMSSMFQGMSTLQELNLGDKFDTSNVKNMRSMFSSVSSLQNLDLSTSNFNTSNVTDMSQMFWGMSSLERLDLSTLNFDTSRVRDMSGMFCKMSVLEKLNLGDKFDTSSVRDMSSMFREMRALQSLDLSTSNFNTSNVTDMSQMFREMSALQSLDLSTSNFNTSNVEDMDAMFGGDELLTMINYGSNFIHKESASTVAMFGGVTSNSLGVSYANCPAKRPDESTHSSWAGVSFDGLY